MKKIIIKNSILAGVAAFALAVTPSVSVLAQNARAQEARNTTTVEREAPETRESRQESAREEATTRRELAKTKLSDAKLRACENRERVITNIMARISDRGEKQIIMFSKIANRTMDYYVDKGLSLDNYDELVNEVADKRSAAEVAVLDVSGASNEFDCNSEDPKGMADSFKASLKSEIEALKAYKTAVRNLIVGVKSSQTADATEEGTAE